MKQILITLLTLIIVSCSSPEKDNSTVTNFLEDISSLEDNVAKGENPIVNFIETAKYSAEVSTKLTKENINDLLIEAKQYNHCVITTGDHTIAIITDLDDCKTSSSWDACMPYAKGYIKKGKLIHQSDYINNIIGLPDDQERILYLFK